jgi:hypothetical protein
MRRIVIALFVLAAIAFIIWLAVRPTRAAAAPTHPPLGINLSGVVDWSSEIVFVDAFKSSRPWLSQAQGKPFGQGGELALDEQGNVTSLREGQWAEALMYVDIGSHYPGGKYILTYEGEGEVQIGGSGKIDKDTGKRKEVTVTPKKDGAEESGAQYSARLSRTRRNRDEGPVLSAIFEALQRLPSDPLYGLATHQ